MHGQGNIVLVVCVLGCSLLDHDGLILQFVKSKLLGVGVNGLLRTRDI